MRNMKNHKKKSTEKYTIIWKWDEEEVEGLPSNVVLSKWLPQQVLPFSFFVHNSNIFPLLGCRNYFLLLLINSRHNSRNIVLRVFLTY